MTERKLTAFEEAYTSLANARYALEDIDNRILNLRNTLVQYEAAQRTQYATIAEALAALKTMLTPEAYAELTAAMP